MFKSFPHSKQSIYDWVKIYKNFYSKGHILYMEET